LSRNEGQDGPGEIRAVHWFISGRVQGVGFRYHVLDAARRHGVDGDVRNLPDGRVEMRASGRDLDGFLAEVRQGPYGSRVDNVARRPLDPVPEFKGFQIRF
jgi:acylphosphatase